MFYLFGHLLRVVDSKQQHYEMAFTPVEFEKTLLGQFITTKDSYTCQHISSMSWKVLVSEGFSVDILISEAPPRIIAMLSLPVLDVNFHFKNTDSDQQKAFLKRFFKYFHKGGG